MAFSINVATLCIKNIEDSRCSDVTCLALSDDFNTYCILNGISLAAHVDENDFEDDIMQLFDNTIEAELQDMKILGYSSRDMGHDRIACESNRNVVNVVPNETLGGETTVLSSSKYCPVAPDTSSDVTLPLASETKVKARFVYKSKAVEEELTKLLSNQDFKNVEEKDNLNNLFCKMASTFIVLGSTNIDQISFTNILRSICFSPTLGQPIRVVSTPFEHQAFHYSLSTGIVSSVLNQSSLFLTDACVASGSEGALVFCSHGLIGMIISSLYRWKDETVTFSIGVSLKSVLGSFSVNQDVSPKVLPKELSFSNLNNQIVLVRSGSFWGSGVILDKTRGIILTCSHVILDDDSLSISYLNKCYPAEVVFKSRKKEPFDLAILSTNRELEGGLSMTICKRAPYWGETVYCVGYPIFNEYVWSHLNVTISQGIISKVVSSTMLHTSCSVHSGVSGGAVINSRLKLVGIVVCNVQYITNEEITTYSKVNMAIPINAIYKILEKYIKTKDTNILKRLERYDQHSRNIWSLRETRSKL